MKPDKPIVYNEFYLDAMTGGFSKLPAPVTPEQHYLAYLAGMAVTLPQPIILRDKFLAKICGMDVDIPTFIPGKFPRKFAYYAKATGQDVDVPPPITREEMYWFDYVSTPSEKEYTGAVPVTFTANGQPLLDYLISGNTVQNGTPAPDNPVMPQGTGERTGNLFDMSFYEGESEITVSGNKATGTCNRFFNVKLSIPPELYGQELTWSAYFKRPDNPNTVRLQTVDNGSYKYGNNITGEGRSTVSFTATSTIRLYVNYANTGSDTIELSDITLNLGSTALPYEPYGYKIPILSNSTTTPVYLGEVETTRKIKKLVLDGTESTWRITGTGRLAVEIPANAIAGQYCFCSHYKGTNVTSLSNLNDKECEVGTLNSSNKQEFVVYDTDYLTAADFKTYLQQQYAAGTPVCVWYVLATPTTGIVNEPIMRIGDYADTLSMEQAGVQIPTANGSTTLDVETTVKPSEVYIKYRGEAVATLSTLSTEVSSPEATPEEVNPEETEETENGSEDVSL